MDDQICIVKLQHDIATGEYSVVSYGYSFTNKFEYQEIMDFGSSLFSVDIKSIPKKNLTIDLWMMILKTVRGRTSIPCGGWTQSFYSILMDHQYLFDDLSDYKKRRYYRKGSNDCVSYLDKLDSIKHCLSNALGRRWACHDDIPLYKINPYPKITFDFNLDKIDEKDYEFADICRIMYEYLSSEYRDKVHIYYQKLDPVINDLNAECVQLLQKIMEMLYDLMVKNNSNISVTQEYVNDKLSANINRIYEIVDSFKKGTAKLINFIETRLADMHVYMYQYQSVMHVSQQPSSLFFICSNI